VSGRPRTADLFEAHDSPCGTLLRPRLNLQHGVRGSERARTQWTYLVELHLIERLLQACCVSPDATGRGVLAQQTRAVRAE
jgi:hypothetical protein